MTQERYYVSAAWHDWPEGGSYGTVVMAGGYEAAERACHDEMAEFGAEEGHDTPAEMLVKFSDEWHIVDCFPLDDFLERHAGAREG